MKLKAKKLILDLLLASKGQPLAAKDLVAACGLFGISQNNVRVTLARLSGEGLIESAGRGQYHLTSAAMSLGGEVNAWREVEKRLRNWAGDYVLVFTGMLGRVDRTALKQRERALQLMGFRELETNLYIRPNNIEKHLDDLRRKLHLLGLPEASLVFLASEFTVEEKSRIDALWNCKALNQSYREQSKKLSAWMKDCDELEPDVAARESFLLGGAAIRAIVFDPLLPEDFVDSQSRHQFFQAMRTFDEVGQGIWASLDQSLPGMSRALGRAQSQLH